MTTPTFSADDGDDLRGLLRSAVEQMRAQTAPADVRAAAIARLIDRLPAVTAATRPRLRLIHAGAAAAIAAVLLIFLFLRLGAPDTQPKPHDNGVAVTAPAPTSRVDMAGASPSRRFAIAAAAPVLVATGNDDQPITLGDAHPYDTNKHVLHVWDWAAAKASKPLPLSYSGPLAVAPDGKTIAIADGRAIAVATGAVTPIDAFPPRVRAMKFAPDGKALLLQLPAADDAATHRLIAFPSGRLICDIPDTWTHTFAATFTPDGQSLVLMGADRVVRRFDAATGKEVAKYPPAHSNSVRALVISPDGKRLATCASSVGEIRLFDLATAKLLREFNVPPADAREPQVYSLAFSRDGRLLAGGGVHRLYLWDAGTAAVRHTFPRNSGGAIHLRFGADDKVLTAVFDFTGLERNGRDLLRYPHVETYAVP